MNIKINANNITFHGILGEHVFSIWLEDYDEVIKAMEKSKQYHCKLNELKREYGHFEDVKER